MGVLRAVFVAGLLISVSFLLSQSFGAEINILQDSEDFSVEYPGGTNWTTDGTLSNVVVNADDELEIDNTSVHAETFEFRRLPLINTEEELVQYSSDTQNIVYIESGDTDLGEYWTKSNSSSSQALAYWYSENFYSQSGNVTVEYAYREISQPTTAQLILWDESANAQEDSTTLDPGVEANDYSVTKELQASSDGQYSIRIEVDEGTYDEQRIYNVRAYQNSSDVGSSTTGIYESDVLFAADDSYISRIEYNGANIQNDISNPQQTTIVTVEGLRDGAVEVSRSLRASNSLRFEEDIFVDSNESIDSIRFDVELSSETSESPKLQSLSISGETAEKIASDRVSFYLQLALLMVLIGMALMYLVKA